MKKLYTFILASVFAGGINAQQLDVIDLLFSEPGGSFQNPMNDTALTKGDTARLWFIVTNNLSNSQALNAGDSLTFGWSVDGNNRGNLIMSNLTNNIANGSNLNAYLTNSFIIASTANTEFEVCTWPLYNPYQPNTDPMVGRHCTKFKTKNETTGGGNNGGGNNGGTTSINLVNVQGVSNFYINNRTISYAFNSVHVSNNIELIDLTGKVVFNEPAERKTGEIELSSDVAPGVYLLKATTATDAKIQKVYVHKN